MYSISLKLIPQHTCSNGGMLFKSKYLLYNRDLQRDTSSSPEAVSVPVLPLKPPFQHVLHICIRHKYWLSLLYDIKIKIKVFQFSKVNLSYRKSVVSLHPWAACGLRKVNKLFYRRWRQTGGELERWNQGAGERKDLNANMYIHSNLSSP